MNKQLIFALPILVALAGIAPYATSAFAQTTTTTGGTTTTTTSTTGTIDHDHHHFFHGGFGGFRGAFGLGASAVILNPTSTSVACPVNAPVPIQAATGTYCVSTNNAATDVFTGTIATPTTSIIIGGTTFGYGGFGFHHGFHFHR